MRIAILDKCWDLIFVPQKVLGPHKEADCDPPDVVKKQIRIRSGAKGRFLADCIIHECLHAASFAVFSEPFVERLATQIANILWRPEVLRRLLKDPKVREILAEEGMLVK